jgi:hypothetical protein
MNRHLKKFLDETNYNVVGFKEDKAEVRVYVQKKMKMPTLQRKVSDPSLPNWTEKDIVPETIKTGVLKSKPTKVIELGNVRALADRKSYKPIRGGCEIGPSGEGFMGTAGAPIQYAVYKQTSLLGRFLGGFLRLFRARGDDVEMRRGLLTNAHVVNRDPTRPVLGASIIQPGISGRVIGTVACSPALERAANNKIDAAIVALNEEPVASIIKVGSIKGYREPASNEVVHKYGRTTEYTFGALRDRGVTVTIDYGLEKPLTFTGVDLYSYMSDRGDSGSVLVSRTDQAAVGLVFAGSSQFSMAIPMPLVVEELGFEFL